MGVGIGRKGDEMREKEKNGIKPYVKIPPGGFEPPSPDPKSCMIDRYTTGVGNDLLSYTEQNSAKIFVLITMSA